MSNFTDAFGSLVTDNGDGTWTRGGVTVHSATQAQAAGTFAGMAPDGWVAPVVPTPAPQTVSPFQFKAVLAAMPATDGRSTSLYAQINTALTTQGGTALMAWEYAVQIDRNSVMVTQMAASLGFTSEQLDAVFVSAAAVSA